MNVSDKVRLLVDFSTGSKGDEGVITSFDTQGRVNVSIDHLANCERFKFELFGLREDQLALGWKCSSITEARAEATRAKPARAT